MAQTWASYGLSNWLFLNSNDMVHGCFILNFRILVSILPDIFKFLTNHLTESAIQRPTQWQDQDIELCNWPAENIFKTMNLCYQESFGLLHLFWPIWGYIENCPPVPLFNKSIFWFWYQIWTYWWSYTKFEHILSIGVNLKAHSRKIWF